MKIFYSRGASIYDAVPENREAASFDEFRTAILADYGQKKGEQWIAAPFANADASHCIDYDKAILGKPHRCRASAQARRWLGLDVDGCTSDAFWRLYQALAPYNALIYTTSSHTDVAPRLRIIIELAHALEREQLKAVTASVRNMLSQEVKWDDGCDKAEQPLFLPTAGSTYWKLEGSPLCPWNHLPQTDLITIDLRNRWLEEIAAAPPGERNKVLNRNAFHLGGLVGAGRLEFTDTERQIIEATCGWTKPRKTLGTIRDAMKKGEKKPLHGSTAKIAETIRSGLDAHAPLPLKPLGPLSTLSTLGQAEVIIQRGDQIVPEPIHWLWPGWLARGKMHISAGAAGTGKTTTACALAATITRGGLWPDGTRAPQGEVLMWSGEDDVPNVLSPRFMACGADMSKVHFITGMAQGGKEYSFDPSKDLPLLADKLHKCPGVVMIIIDPIVSAVGGDSHKNTETRRALQPLVDLASKFNCALLGITHLSKGTQGRDVNERVAGSLAFVALARLVFMSATSDAKEGAPQRRIFVRSKSNLGPNTGGFEYSLEYPELPGYPGVTGSKVIWGAAVDGSARSLLTQMESAELPNSARRDARAWLLDRLAHGQVAQKQIKSDALAEGHSWATLRRAKDDAKVIAQKTGDGWVWRLPLTAPPKPLLLNADQAVQGAQGAQAAQLTPKRSLPLPPLLTR